MSNSLEEKKLEQAIVRGAELMIDFGLGDWKVMLHSKRTTLADCNIGTKTIRYSTHFLKVAEKDQLEGVTYHEIAHALLPTGVGHGRAFVDKCIEISPNPDYARRGVKIPIHKYNIFCPKCGVSGYGNRKRNNKRHIICSRCTDKYGKDIKFVYEENVLAVKSWD